MMLYQMFRNLFDVYGPGYPYRCVVSEYEITKSWANLRKLAGLLRKVWSAMWIHGRTRRRTKVGDFTKFEFPMVRESYPALLIDDIISVQPMSSHVASLDYIKMQYNKKQGLFNYDPMA